MPSVQPTLLLTRARAADRVTVGHGAILHACTIEDGAFVGMVRAEAG